MKETRVFSAPVEVREADDGTATIAGYGAVFGNEYEVAGFTESVDPKAFNRSIKNSSRDLAVVWSHDADRVLGTWTAIVTTTDNDYDGWTGDNLTTTSNYTFQVTDE